jgi:hypothetical protein
MIRRWPSNRRLKRLDSLRRPPRKRRRRLAGFLFKLETAAGEAAEPSTLRSAVPDWRAGDTIPLGKRTLRVLAVRDNESGDEPVLIVEDMAG